MKTEQLIVQYLYSNKKLTLRDIGTFTVSPEINIVTDSEKDAVLPPDSISFEFDAKAAEDEELIDYIVQQTRKIRPLAASDLESFIILNRQFLNIGKPFVIEGLGTLQKNRAGEYAFTQSGTSHVIHGELPKQVTEKQNETITFGTALKEKKNGRKKTVLFVLFAVALIGSSITAYYFITKNKNGTVPAQSTVVTENTGAVANDDSVLAAKPAAVPAKNTMDTNSFYIVIKQYHDKTAAVKSFQKLTSYGNKLVLTTKDSLSYRLKMPFQLPVSDTLRVKDSLAKFFGGNPFVELPQLQ